MATHKTEDLLNLCRNARLRQNEKVETAISELSSYIVFASLLEYESELPEELESRVEFLRDVQANPDQYPQDIFPEEDDLFIEVPEDDGPSVA